MNARAPVLSPAGESFFAGLCGSIALAAFVILGGAIRDAFLVTAGLEIAACLILVWCLVDRRLNNFSLAGLWMLGIIWAAGLVCLVQLIPLPNDIWTGLAGREVAADGYKVMALGEVSQPLSLQPDRTLYGVLRLLPPLAVFVLFAKLPWRAISSLLPWTIVALACASGLAALAQMLASHELLLFPYGVEAGRRAVGVFEVVNHQATLQLMAIPFAGVLVAKIKDSFDTGGAYQAQILLVIAAALMIVVATVLSGSLAGYAMAIPVIVLSSFWLFSDGVNFRFVVAALVGAGALGAVGYLVFSSQVNSGFAETDLSDSPMGRLSIYRNSFEMVQHYFPWGSGLGSFENAYPAFEDPSITATGYASHAHNEYIEIAIELGLAGIVILVFILGWWAVMTFHAWRAPREEGGRLKRAASVAAGVVFAHSLVDFPARTEAISCLGAACLAIMASGPHRAPARKPSRPGPRPGQEIEAGVFQHRHIEI